MQAFAVKHITAEQGSIGLIMKEVKKTPFAYTSKSPEAHSAAKGGIVYVIEVQLDRKQTTYWFAYWFRAKQLFTLPGGARWRDRFEFKVSAQPGEKAEGLYIEPPVRITSVTVCNWLSTKQPGMSAIPSHVLAELESIVIGAGRDAEAFA